MRKINGIETGTVLDAIESLIASCEQAFTSPDTDMMEDAEDDICSPPIGITFRQIWHARDAFNNLREHFAPKAGA